MSTEYDSTTSRGTSSSPRRASRGERSLFSVVCGSWKPHSVGRPPCLSIEKPKSRNCTPLPGMRGTTSGSLCSSSLRAMVAMVSLLVDVHVVAAAVGVHAVALGLAVAFLLALDLRRRVFAAAGAGHA